MSSIRIRIGATLDADLASIVFKPLVAAAKEARAQVRRELEGIGDDLNRVGGRARRGGGAGAGAGGGGGGGGLGAGVSGPVQMRQKTYAQLEREEEKHQRRMTAIAVREQKAAAAEQKKLASEVVAVVRQANQEKEKEQRKQEQAAKQQQARIEGEAKSRSARVGEGTVRNFGGLVRRGVGVASDVARGAGIDFGIGNAVQGRFDLQKRAIDLSNASYMAGQSGPAGQRQDPRKLMAEVQGAADAAGLDTGQAMEGLQSFVGKTGDLATGRAVLGDLAKLSRATAAEMGDVVSAAGDVSANLADTPDKAQRVLAVMRAIAGQGKVGAVEMKDLASQMAKLAASAPMFAGDVQANMGAMGALAQMARAGGGAASATQAATSVQGFVGTFGKKARRDAFKSAGVKIEDEQGMLLDPEEIIVNSLKATGGKRDKMNKLFMDASAQRVTRGFQNLFVQAGGGAAGEKAVREKFASLRSASMGGGEIEESFKASMGSNEAQAQVLKNRIQKDLGDAIEKLAPKLLELVPNVTSAVKAFGDLVVWAASNPLKAAFLGLGASVVKSVGEEMLRGGAARAFGGVMGGGGGGGGPGAGGGFLGGMAGGSKLATAANVASTAFAITAAAVTIASVGMLAIDKVMNDSQKAENNERTQEDKAFNATVALDHAQKAYDQDILRNGVASPEVTAALQAARAEADKAAAPLSKRASDGEAWNKMGTLDKLGTLEKGSINSMLQWIGVDSRVGDGRTIGDIKEAQISAERLSSIQQELAGLRTGTLNVKVMNQPGPGAPPLPGGAVGP